MGIDWYLKSIGIGLLALAILVAIYVIVMLVYFGLRKKWPYQKYLPEIIIVLVTLILSIVFKGIMVGKYGGANEDPCKPAYVITRAIYDAFGGFTFEGLAFDINDKSTEISILLYSFYVGTTLLSALTFVSVVTAKVSYEIYSRLRLKISRSLIVRFFVKIFSFFAKIFKKEVDTHIDTYIFTGLTNETLELAKSIDNQESDNNEPRKKRIIFTGDDIPDFDRDNELCREVMEHDFWYISGSGNKQQSIAARLHLNKKNSQGRFVVFSFVADQHIPAEETNMDIVVSDVKARIQESKATKDVHINDQLLIEYFILTKRDINYQAYQKMMEELKQKHCDHLPNRLELYRYGRQGQRELNYKFWAKVFGLKGYAKKLLELIEPKQQEEYTRQYIEKKISRKDYDKYMDEFKETVSLNVWNEANAIADSMASFLNDKFATSNDKCVYVWSLGFGQTAQAICKELYVQTARIDDQGKASEFFVDAFDTNTKDIGGILAYEEPMSIYLDKDVYFFATNQGNATDSINAYEIERKDKIDCYVDKQTKVKGDGTDKTLIEQQWEKEYRPFAVNLHDISCLDKKFLKSADGYTGLAKSVDRAPQYIVVATGDDYRNIRIVNAMVFDVLNEKERVNTSGKPQVIFVNVWDGKNNDLINTYDIGERQDDPDKSCQVIEFKNSKKSKPYLYVVILGNNDQIYSNSMLSYEDYAKFHEQYELATKDLKQEEIVVKEKNIYEMLSKENRFQLTPKEVNNIVDNIKKLESKEIDFIKSMPKKYNIFNINEIKTIKSLPEKKIKVFESLTIADIDNIIEKYKENPVFKLTEIKKIVPKCKYLSKKDILLICQLENIGLTSKDIVKVLLLEDEEIEKYNTIYSKLDETQFKIIQELSLEQIQNIEKKDHINEYVKEKCNKLLESMNTESGIKNQPQDKSQLRNMWNALSLWEKKSNADVYFYSNVFYKAMNEVEEKDAVQQYNTFTRLLIQEHQRWMRLHFVHGWEYGEKIKTRRIHDCLCPYIFVDSTNCRYDMFNVMLSKAIVASKPQTSDNNPEPNNTNQENSQGKKQ